MGMSYFARLNNVAFAEPKEMKVSPWRAASISKQLVDSRTRMSL